MDFVYLCGPTKTDELKYSIRSVAKNFDGSNICLVGEIPDWYVGDSIAIDQRRAEKYRNAQNNLKAIAASKSISESFVLMNDDFFIVEMQNRVPYMYGGLLKDRVVQYQAIAPHSSYTQMLNETYYWLIKNGINDPLDYELHVPMVMEKSKLNEAIIPGILWRSVYGNMNNVGGIQMNDVKIYSSKEFDSKNYDYTSGSSAYISTDDVSFELVKNDLLIDLFPDQSKYES